MAGLTQEELAEQIGVTPSAVGNYERDVSHPREDILYRLFEALDCEPNDLFAGHYSIGGRRDSVNPDRQQGDCEEKCWRQHMKKYCSLDSRGREIVDVCTEIEYMRCSQKSEAVCDTDFDSGQNSGEVLIAARGNGAPHKIPMKKRRGAGSILDKPSYGGGGK